MRYEKAEIVLRIALDMQVETAGLTLDDLRARYTDAPISRRTAERLRDAVERVFPGFEQANPGEVPKRWRIARSPLARLAGVAAEDLAALEAASRAMDRDGRIEDAARLADLGRRIRVTLPAAMELRLATDVAALAEAEGLATRPGARERVDPAILAALREAILAVTQIRLHYRARGTGALSRPIVCPYGFLYGARHYLVAFSMNRTVRDYRLYALANIERVEPLDAAFERRPFDLKAYAARSFGVFRDGEPVDVVLRFAPHAATDAARFHFHPSQTVEPQPDGTLIVRFHACGLREIAWHLFTWGEAVTILGPEALREQYREQLQKGSAALSASTDPQQHSLGELQDRGAASPTDTPPIRDPETSKKQEELR